MAKVVLLALKIHSQIYGKNRHDAFSIFRGRKKDDSWNKAEVKISWRCSLQVKISILYKFVCQKDQSRSRIQIGRPWMRIQQNYMYPTAGFRIRIRIRINLSCWIRIRIRIQIADPDPGGEKLPKKIEKRTEFSSFEVLDVHFWGLKASPVAWASFMEA